MAIPEGKGETTSSAPAENSPDVSRESVPAVSKPGKLSTLMTKFKAFFQSEEGIEVVPRRRRIATACILGFLGTNFFMFLRFFFPRTLYEPKTVFRIGYPSDFSFGVDTKFQKDYRIWVVRDAESIFVLYARCTHLGCTPDWKPSENKFKCPCHGSGYDSAGINFEGPAPRPLDRAKVELDAEGQITVDTSVLYDWPKGSRSHFKDPGAFIPV